MTTKAQLRANRANALRSTGPRTPEGKAVSSMNATTHALWRTTARAVPRGVFQEDPDEIGRFLEEIVADLYPRDMIEQRLAESIAMTYLDLDRLAALKAYAISGITTSPRAPKPSLDPTNADDSHA